MHVATSRGRLYQGYSERQDFSPFPLLETCSFFLIWYYTKQRCLYIFLATLPENWCDEQLEISKGFLDCVCKTKLEKKNMFLIVERLKQYRIVIFLVVVT